MATATKKARAAKQLARRAPQVRVPASLAFLIYEDNGDDYHWTIVAGDGATLARSGGFGSYADAEKAARQVRDGAASARFERHAKRTGPVDLTARRDNPDAERWLDEGGSFNGQVVKK
jgi:uncharacterized protein YegP (UPF0339 family)